MVSGRTKKERQELKNIQNKITKLQKKIDVYQLLTKKAAKSSRERVQEHRARLTDIEKNHEQEAAKMRMRKLRGKLVDNATADEMDEVQVQVHAGTQEVEQEQNQEEQEMEAEVHPQAHRLTTPRCATYFKVIHINLSHL